MELYGEGTSLPQGALPTALAASVGLLLWVDASGRVQCGTGEASLTQYGFALPDSDTHVVAVAWTDTAALFVSAAGTVLVAVRPEEPPRPLAVPAPVSHVACGVRHALLLTRAGAVFQLDNERASSAERVGPSEVRFCAIACGALHSAAVGAGVLWTWGCNRVGQLGLPDAGLHVATPTAVQGHGLGGLAVTRVACGLLHTVAVAEGAETPVFGFGSNQFGALGPGDDAPWFPITQAVRDVQCGNRHTVVHLSDGRVVVFGWPPHRPIQGPVRRVLASHWATYVEPHHET